MSDGPDPAFAGLLADPRMALRRPPAELPIAVVRAAANRFMAQVPRAEIHATQDIEAPGPAGPMRLRLYLPSGATLLPVILFCHGGGFMFGDLETHDAMCRTLALAAGAAVVAVDYRLAPEHVCPAAADDCLSALRWIEGAAARLGLDVTRLAIAGDSAGGQLAAATALRAIGEGRAVDHVAMLYPLLDPRRASPSATRFEEGYMLTGSFVDWAWESYAAASQADAVYDLAHVSLAGLKSATIVTAEFDPLRDEGEAFAARLEAAGVAVMLRRYSGMIHGFAGMPHYTRRAEDVLSFVGARIRSALSRSGLEDH